jgi:isoaspartyl peptidase/L-asparaginase-like protein (Ntn-hydrolase superfamily)
VELIVHGDSGSVSWPAVLVHGGAGTYARLYEGGSDAALMSAHLATALEAATEAGWGHLVGESDDPVAAVVAAVRSLEDDGEFNAGRGSVPNSAGEVEMDAGLMDDDGRAGAVACIRRHSAIAAAEEVLRLDGPVLLAGPNADLFARQRGIPLIETAHAIRTGAADPSSMADHRSTGGPASSQGTVGAVAVSSDGRFAAASSTGGRPGQVPGRVGDTPLPGAGVWAEAGCAVSATGAGEAFVLAGFSRLVAAEHLRGGSLTDSLRAGLLAVGRYGVSGGGIALSGTGAWGACFSTKAMARSLRHQGGSHTVILG